MLLRSCSVPVCGEIRAVRLSYEEVAAMASVSIEALFHR